MRDKELYVKQHGPGVEADWLRYRLLEDIASKMDKLQVPRAVLKDENHGTISYEYFNFPPASLHYLDNPQAWFFIGSQLAKLQARDIRAPDGLKPAPFLLSSLGVNASDQSVLSCLPITWMHGDFWHGNVFLDGMERIIVIDPIPAPFMPFADCVTASGAVDAAFMYMSLFICHPLRKQVFIRVSKIRTAAEAFLDGYAGCGADYSELKNALRRLATRLAEIWVAGYWRRLPYPIAVVKVLATRRNLHYLKSL